MQHTEFIKSILSIVRVPILIPSWKPIYFGEEPANGRLDELCDMVITDIGLYSDTISEPQITISEMEFVDNGRNLEFSPPKNCIQEDGHVDEKQ